MILKIAWKNMFRYKRRTLITAFAISCGVFFTMLLYGLLDGMDKESYLNMIEYETASAKIYTQEYFDNKDTYPFDSFIEKDDCEKIENFLEEKKISYTPSVMNVCEIYFNEDYFETAGSINAVLCGIDIEKANSVYKLENCLESGNWFSKEDGLDYSEGAIVGSWIATDMKAQEGYYITIECKGKGGFTQTFDVPIVGIIQCPNNKINAGVIYMDIKFLDQMLELDGSVTEYAISGCKNGNYSVKQADKDFLLVNETFKQNIENANLYSWREINSDVIFLQSQISKMSSLMMFFMFIIAAVGISNTMLMSVMERKNEIAMLKAMGYTKFYIERLFMWEGVFIGFVGCIVGLVIGCLVNIPLVKYGIDFTSMLSSVDMGYRISGLLRSTWNFAGFIKVAIGALIISAFSAFLPTVSTVKKEIADILRKD